MKLLLTKESDFEILALERMVRYFNSMNIKFWVYALHDWRKREYVKLTDPDYSEMTFQLVFLSLIDRGDSLILESEDSWRQLNCYPQSLCEIRFDKDFIRFIEEEQKDMDDCDRFAEVVDIPKGKRFRILLNPETHIERVELEDEIKWTTAT